MIALLLLLSVCAGVGLSYDVDSYEYGRTYRMRLHRGANFIEFRSSSDYSVTILWSRDKDLAGEDKRRRVMGNYYVISNLTQKDSGRYTMKDVAKNTLSVYSIVVSEHQSSVTRNPGETFSVSFDGLEPKSCYIYFIPDREMSEIEIVHRGRLQHNWPEPECRYFKILKPCGIKHDNIEEACSGRFEVRDQNGDSALVISLEVLSESHYNPSHIGIGIGVFLSVLSCCGCVKRCCCGKSSKTNGSEAGDAEPAEHYQEYESEPVGPRQDHISESPGTVRPSQPSYAPTFPTPNNPPPSYSELSARAVQEDTPMIPVQSDSEPRFELKGMKFSSASPLSSDSTHCDVYDSAKLNFL